MKKSIAILKGLSLEKGVLSMLLTLLFLALSQGAVSAQNNTVGTGSMPGNAPAIRQVYNVPAGPFVSVEVAKTRLMDAVLTQRQIMAQNSPGSAAYIAAERRARYFMAIHENLVAGKGVAESIADAVPTITMSATPGSAATPEEALVERNAAINLLHV